MRARLRILIALALLPIYWIASPVSPAFAATGDGDTYFNLEANTTSSHSYAISTQDSNLHFTSAFSFEMWLYPTNACSGVYCHFLTKEEEYVFAVVNGTYQFALNPTSGGWAWQDTTIKAQLNSWQHIAMTHAAGVNLVSFYLNGQLAYTSTANALTTLNFNNPNSNFEIGARTSNTNDLNAAASMSFIGSIDEVKLWQTVRTQSEIQSDMSSYGPTNDSNLKAYYDFNDISAGVITNKASAGGATLTIKNSPVISTIESTTVANGIRTVRFPRSYISANGWKPPLGISSMNALVVGGGGGGGNNVGNGGGGGGAYLINNLAVNNSSSIGVKVGFGGNGGRTTAAGNVTYDGTTLMDGQRGDSSVATVNGSSFVGGGGGGGDTIWSSNACGTGTGAVSLAGSPGVGSGSGGTSYTGGAGGAISSVQATANGASGFTSNFTGTSLYYGSGGGAGGWSSYVTGNGADSQGGRGDGSNGLNLTGSGGGGNASGCAVGGKGGSGIVIFTMSAFGGTVNSIASAIFRQPTSVTVNLSEAGKVFFYERGKAIPGCKPVLTTGSSTFTATCTWKPATRGNIVVTARFVPASLPSSSVPLSFGTIPIASRSGKR